MSKKYRVLPLTPQLRPKSVIYTPKRVDEHPVFFFIRKSARGSFVAVDKNFHS